MPLKIAVIGAGSLGFTRKLVQDILSVPELQNTTFALTDISARNLKMVATLVERDIKANNIPAKVISTTDRRAAVEGAAYVINTARVGGLEAFETDVMIPLKYGVDQCVGDTLCAGGIMYGQRGIAAMLDFCKDVREAAKPNALFLNYGNPNAMMTWAGNHFGGVRTIGLCHGVQGGHAAIAEVIALMINKGKSKDSKGYQPVTVEDVDIICAGINHQTWYIRAMYKGEDWATRLIEGFEMHPYYSQVEKTRIDLIKRFGYFTTESNGHVSEYLAWYRKRPSTDMKNWIPASDNSPFGWINGRTGGYLEMCKKGRNAFIKDYAKWLKQPPAQIVTGKRSHEHCSGIIEGLETGRVYRGHFNVVNNGTITNLPNDAIVEVPGYVDRNGISIPKVGDLPLGCAAVCNASISVQRLAVEAAVRGDVMLLKQAMMMDPLVGAVCNPPEIWQMTDEMLVAQAKWLPQYKKEIPRAKARLAMEKPLAKNALEGTGRKTA